MSEKSKLEQLQEALAELPDSIQLSRSVLLNLLEQGMFREMRDYSLGLFDMAHAMKLDKELILKLATVRGFLR